VGAVQVRKAIANGKNFWTQGQVAEMALDSYFQQQRIALVALANCAATVSCPANGVGALWGLE